MEDSLWSKIAFGITCKLLCENDIFLDGWITSAITGLIPLIFSMLEIYVKSLLLQNFTVARRSRDII